MTKTFRTVWLSAGVRDFGSPDVPAGSIPRRARSRSLGQPTSLELVRVAGDLVRRRSEFGPDALYGVVDGLHVAAERVADLLVGLALHIQREHLGLQAGHALGYRAPQRLEALARHECVGGVAVGARGGQLAHPPLPQVVRPPAERQARVARR